jgi:hypothetical protein
MHSHNYRIPEPFRDQVLISKDDNVTCFGVMLCGKIMLHWFRLLCL